MAEFVTVKMRCPLCGTEFAADEIHGAEPVARETDFRPVYEGPDPILSHMHACPRCHYAAYREGFDSEPTDEDELIEELDEDPKALVRPFVTVPDDDTADDLRRYARSGELAEGLVEEGREPFGAVRYLVAARAHEFVNDDEPLGAAHYLLRSAWSARATGDVAQEKRALREVLLRLSNVLENAENLAEAERMRLSYLAGETARRAGDFGRAVDYFARVEKDADPDEDEGALLAALARRQALLAHVQSAVNAVIPPDVARRRRAPGEDEIDDELLDDSEPAAGDDDDGESSLN